MLKRTIKVPSYIVIVDNNSSDGTQEWAQQMLDDGRVNYIILNPDNYYPGKATNIGWEKGLELYPEATHLMRLDNDMELKEGWDTAAEDYFDKIPELGQLGLDHEAIENPKALLREREINGKKLNPWPGCVGGPNIIRRKVWDSGIRYQDLRWDDDRQSPLQEDSGLSKAIHNQGWLFGHMTENLSRTFANQSNWSDYPEYYTKTMTDRGYVDNVKLIEEKK
jgi:glycosyltransferase involved in cell wall biosynthesis